jgi:AraC-like DNA-binding protein/mannose-6-phosphate isomerase-like protein (cupin superfamily)
MQNQLRVIPKYYEVNFSDDDFPINFFTYTQQYRTQNDMHYHKGLEIGICIEGSGIFFIGNEILPFTKGDVSIIMPNEIHIAQSPNEKPSTWKFINIDTSKLQIDFPYGISTIITDPLISNIVHSIYEELNNEELQYRQAVYSYLHILGVKLSRRTECLKLTSAFSFTKSNAIAPALSFIQKNYRNNISVSDLASLCNFSTSHFRRIFKETVGISPQAYLHETRIKFSRVLLETTALSVTYIAESSGYTTLSSFNRTFKACFGVSPSQCRKNYIK